MSNVSFDFGFLVALVLPGLIAVFGLAHFSEFLRKQVNTLVDHSGPHGGAVFTITMASLFLGMMLSALRVTFVDPYFGEYVTIDYFSLQDEGVREAFELAVDDKRLLQFHGNSALAISLWALGKVVEASRLRVREWLFAWPRLGRALSVAACAVCLAAVVSLLVTRASKAHTRWTSSVKAFATQLPTNDDGRAE